MKVLLTGASGFVGSHILDYLVKQQIPTAILLRHTSKRTFIEPHLQNVDIRQGSINDPVSLSSALHDITHVIHCAGCTKAIDDDEYFRVNRDGTRHIVDAINQYQSQIQQLIHISSLAASHPATTDNPARETDNPAPVTIYGHSKLAGEHEIQNHLKVPSVILRPAAVYGPRDSDFLLVFKAVRGRLIPSFGAGRQQLSLAYVEDIARSVITCLLRQPGGNPIMNVAHPEIITSWQLTEVIARQLGVTPIKIPLPLVLLWPVCLFGESISRITRKPSIVNLQKYPELSAAGWVCDSSQMATQLGIEATTDVNEGIRKTHAWYQQQGWLP